MYHGRVVCFPFFFGEQSLTRPVWNWRGPEVFPLNRGGESRIWESLNQMTNQSTEGGGPVIIMEKHLENGTGL